MRQDGQSAGLVVLVCHFQQPGLRLGIFAQKQERYLTEGPFQVGIADFVSGRPLGLAR